MDIVVACPNLKCRAVLNVAESARGKRVKCSQCGSVFLIPELAKPGDGGTTAAPARAGTGSRDGKS